MICVMVLTVGIRMLPIWLRNVSVYQGPPARGTVFRRLRDWDIFHGRGRDISRIGASLAGVRDLEVKAFIAEFGDLGDSCMVRAETCLADACRIGIETPLSGVGDLWVGTSIADVWRIKAATSLAGSWSGTQASVVSRIIGTELPYLLVTEMDVPDNEITEGLGILCTKHNDSRCLSAPSALSPTCLASCITIRLI